MERLYYIVKKMTYQVTLLQTEATLKHKTVLYFRRKVIHYSLQAMAYVIHNTPEPSRKYNIHELFQGTSAFFL